jgi:hypothetical protein
MSTNLVAATILVIAQITFGRVAGSDAEKTLRQNRVPRRACIWTSSHSIMSPRIVKRRLSAKSGHPQRARFVGLYTPLCHFTSPPGWAVFDSHTRLYPSPNLTHAKRLLAKASIPNPAVADAAFRGRAAMGAGIPTRLRVTIVRQPKVDAASLRAVRVARTAPARKYDRRLHCAKVAARASVGPVGC